VSNEARLLAVWVLGLLTGAFGLLLLQWGFRRW